MDWSSFFYAPAVYVIMVPFWFFMTYMMGAAVGRDRRSNLAFSAWWSIVSASVVYAVLFAAPGLIWGTYSW